MLLFLKPDDGELLETEEKRKQKLTELRKLLFADSLRCKPAHIKMGVKD